MTLSGFSETLLLENTLPDLGSHSEPQAPLLQSESSEPTRSWTVGRIHREEALEAPAWCRAMGSAPQSHPSSPRPPTLLCTRAPCVSTKQPNSGRRVPWKEVKGEAEAKEGAPACLLGIPCKGVEGEGVEEPEAHWGKGLSFWEQHFLGGSASTARVSDLWTFHLGTSSLNTLAVFTLGEGRGQIGAVRVCAWALEQTVRAGAAGPRRSRAPGSWRLRCRPPSWSFILALCPHPPSTLALTAETLVVGRCQSHGPLSRNLHPG